MVRTFVGDDDTLVYGGSPVFLVSGLTVAALEQTGDPTGSTPRDCSLGADSGSDNVLERGSRYRRRHCRKRMVLERTGLREFVR